ncbi:MAG TPA: iron transporter FeoB [Cyanobacteria bacterium UBA8543]|nr:iron transporter FeoB [Cyanobacteria bacterium UBA8543]
MNSLGCPQGCSSNYPKVKRDWSKLFQSNIVTPTYTSKLISTIALVGSPNVGKSLIFNSLTGTYSTVSNYPGTTVEISQGEAFIAGKTVTVIDTPGMYSFLTITEEERVTRDLLFTKSVDLVIHVVDAKNLGRMLSLTLQLIEARLPVLLVVNMIDEVERLGMWVDRKKLEKALGIPVVKMSALLKLGIQELKAKIATYV